MWNIIFGLFYQKQIETTKNPKIEKIEKGMESSVDVNLWNIFKQKFERKLFIEVRFFHGDSHGFQIGACKRVISANQIEDDYQPIRELVT